MPANLLCQHCGKEFEAKRSDAKWCPQCREFKQRERQAIYETHKRDICPQCGKSIVRRAKLCLSCENKTRRERYKGENNPNWRNGWTRADGYIYIRVRKPEEKGHPYRAQHIVVWEQTHGQPLPKGWVVHHFNGIRDDNRPENLFGMPRKRHNMKLAFEPYEQRIKQLEAEISK